MKPKRIRKPIAKVRRNAGSASCSSQGAQKRPMRTIGSGAFSVQRDGHQRRTGEIEQREEQEALFGADEARDVMPRSGDRSGCSRRRRSRRPQGRSPCVLRNVPQDGQASA